MEYPIGSITSSLYSFDIFIYSEISLKLDGVYVTMDNPFFFQS